MILFKREIIGEEDRIKIERITNSGPYPRHRHEFIELVYILAGGGIQTVDGTDYAVEHGSLLFIDFGQTHSLQPDRSMTYVHLLLEPDFFSRELVNAESIADIFRYSMLSEFSGKTENTAQCVRFSGEERKKADRLTEEMLEEYTRKEPGYRTVLRADTQKLLAWFLRRRNAGTPEVIQDSLQDVVEYINKHFTEKIELNDIAAKGFYNADYLSRLLKKSCGKSFSQYVKEKRIEQAAELLRVSENSVQEIMIASGYTDSKMFYRHFREVYGCAPGEYRREKKELPKEKVRIP